MKISFGSKVPSCSWLIQIELLNFGYFLLIIFFSKSFSGISSPVNVYNDMSSSGMKQDADKMALKQAEENNIIKEKKILQSLYVVWNNIGIDEEQQLNRANQVWGHVFSLLEAIVEDETVLYEKIKECVKNYRKKISGLLEELSLPKGEEVDGTLIMMKETLRQQLYELSKIKNMRLKDFQELRSIELKYCKMLGMPILSLSSTTGVPTEKDIYELQQHVNMLKGEKEQRQKRFHILKKELTTILEVTELTPETPLEKEILTSKEDNLSLSNETFKLLEQIVTKTKSKKIELENERAGLMDKLTMLWDVMKIDKDERDKFLSQHACCRVSSLNAIKGEIARCEEIKRQNIKKYVEALHEELASLCEKCFMNNLSFISNFFQVEELNEDVLESYDKEVSKWRKYYKDTEHIIQKIRKRQELWDLMIIFENKANDPNRFKNRGGNLLQEERERKKLQKDLPALENEIFQDIDQYEQESGKQFLYYGENFRIFVTKQWEDRTAQKENEKKYRQKLRTQQLEEERTPAKRPFCTTPKSAPSKLLKSSVGMSIYRTPVISSVKKVPSTTAKMRNLKMSVLQSSNGKKNAGRSVLKEKNVNKAETSNFHNSTTYTDFEEKLNRSSRYAHRSSVLSSRKIVGTRTSINKSKRKSSSVSTRKSLRKKANSSKITPARGKLGLPFLI